MATRVKALAPANPNSDEKEFNTPADSGALNPSANGIIIVCDACSRMETCGASARLTKYCRKLAEKRTTA